MKSNLGKRSKPEQAANEEEEEKKPEKDVEAPESKRQK